CSGLAFSLTAPPPVFPLFPYATLFRSRFAAFAALGDPRELGHRQRLAARSRVPPGVAQDPLGRVGPAGPAGERRPQRLAPLCERSEEHTSELQSLTNIVCRLLLEKKTP